MSAAPSATPAGSPAIDAETPPPVLAFDIGGANGMAALVQDGRVLERRRVLVRRDSPPGAVLEAASEAATAWRGRCRRAVMIETDQPGSANLATGLGHRTGLSVTSLPLAQAAAWSEHRFGTNPGGDLVFLLAGLTIGGAVVSGGALLRGAHGLAGQLGRLRGPDGRTVAEAAGGAGLLQRASVQGVRDLEGLLGAASAGARWAMLIVEDAAAALANAIAAVQAVVDPPVIVVGGALGAAPGMVDRLHGRLADVTPRPNVVAATAGPDAALVGAADHAARQAAVLALPSS